MIIQKDTLGNITTYTYDGTGKLTDIELPDGGVLGATYGVGSNSDTINAVSYGANKSEYTYDNLGNITSIKTATGSITSYSYNLYGELTETTDALGNKTRYGYDCMGNCTEITYADGSIATATYDSMGRVVTASIEVTDILTGEERTVSESYTYDTMGNVASHTDTMGNVTYYEYDLNNQLIKVTDRSCNKKVQMVYLPHTPMMYQDRYPRCLLQARQVEKKPIPTPTTLWEGYSL